MTTTATIGGERAGSTREAVERLTPLVEEHRDAGEVERRLPDAVFAAVRDAELLKLWAPREYGGDEVDLRTFMEAVERVSRADGATGWTFAILAAGGLLTAFLPRQGVDEIYANGPNVAMPGSVIPNGRAVAVEGGYNLTGRWPLASGCHHGQWLSGVSLVLEGDAPRMGPAGPDLQVLFFGREQCEILDTWHSLGLRGTGSTDIAVEDVFVPEHRAFPLFTAQPAVAGPLYRTGIVALFSLALTPVLIGIAEAAIDAFVELAKGKTPTLSQSALGTRATVHADVARARAMVRSARAYLYEVADELMAAAIATGAVPDQLEAERRLACAHVGATCPRAVDLVFSLAGKTPVYTGERLERCLRDVRVAAQHMLVSPAWWEKTGQYYFGLGLGMP